MTAKSIIGLYRRELDDPRLQVTRVTAESGVRTRLVNAQLDRQRFRTDAGDENAYLASLQIQVRFERLVTAAKLDRIEELFRRTTQFNATGHVLTVVDLQKLIADPTAHVFTLYVSDRFGDHGLVGAAVVEGGEITGLVLSCRVLGMGVEHQFMWHIIAAVGGNLTARIIETERNIPVRNIYRDNSFIVGAGGVWLFLRK